MDNISILLPVDVRKGRKVRICGLKQKRKNKKGGRVGAGSRKIGVSWWGEK